MISLIIVTGRRQSKQCERSIVLQGELTKEERKIPKKGEASYLRIIWPVFILTRSYMHRRYYAKHNIRYNLLYYPPLLLLWFVRSLAVSARPRRSLSYSYRSSAIAFPKASSSSYIRYIYLLYLIRNHFFLYITFSLRISSISNSSS